MASEHARDILRQFMLDSIVAENKLHVLQQVRINLEDSELPPPDQAENDLDLIFVHCNNEFPDDEFDLLVMYVQWLEAEFGVVA